MHAFRYFPGARASPLSSWQDVPRACGLCGRERAGFAGNFYGRGSLAFACEECLGSGVVGDAGFATNQGDVAALRTQLAPLPDDARERLVQARTQELETRTPHLTTWQDLVWPAHCGDYCRFVSEVGKRELAALAPDGDGEAFFAAHLHPSLDGTEDDYGAIVPPHAPGRGEQFDVGVYLFQCLGCARHVLLWDAS